MSRIGIVVGMQSEAARIAAPFMALPFGFRPPVFVAGASALRAYEGARVLESEGIDGLMSLGLGGALDPALGCGDIVLADGVLDPSGERFATDDAWCARLREALAGHGPVAVGALAGVDAPVASRDGKAALRQRSGALAVDMESHGVARAAHESGLPFAALRVILDEADRAIPAAALAGLGPEGEARLWPVLGRLLVRPWQLPGLIALGRANDKALAVLGRLAADLGPGFVFGP